MISEYVHHCLLCAPWRRLASKSLSNLHFKTAQASYLLSLLFTICSAVRKIGHVSRTFIDPYFSPQGRYRPHCSPRVHNGLLIMRATFRVSLLCYPESFVLQKQNGDFLFLIMRIWKNTRRQRKNVSREH